VKRSGSIGVDPATSRPGAIPDNASVRRTEAGQERSEWEADGTYLRVGQASYKLGVECLV